MLHWFADRAGAPPVGQCFGWDGWIKGSATGNYLMGAGSFLQYVDDSALRASVEMVVAGIRQYQNTTSGWLWAFNETDIDADNLPDYCAGWVTRKFTSPPTYNLTLLNAASPSKVLLPTWH